MTHEQRTAISAARLKAFAALVCVAALFLSVSDVSAQRSPQRRHARVSADLEDRLQAGDNADTSVIVTGTKAKVDAIAARHGLRIRKRLKTGAVLDVPAGGLGDLAADVDLDALSSNYRLRAHMAVTTVAIGADQVWEDGWAEGATGVTGEGVVVAVIDSGVANVPELSGRIVASMDFTVSSKRRGQRMRSTSDEAPTYSSEAAVRSLKRDPNGHGTHVAGIIAAAGENRYDDTRGVAPDAQIIDLRVLDANGDGFAGDVVDAIDWAVANRDRYRIRVINLSLGGPVLQACADDPVCQAVERAYRAGIVVVASAGNNGKDEAGNEILGGITVPGNSPFAITAGALNTKQTPWRSDDELTTYSSRGVTRFDHLIKPDLVAPGNKIRGLLAPGSTLAKEHPELVIDTTEGKRLQLSGTSMAAAAVSGATALLLDYSWELSPAGARFALQYGASPIAGTGLIRVGAGSLNIAATLKFDSGDLVTIAGETVQAGGLA